MNFHQIIISKAVRYRRIQENLDWKQKVRIIFIELIVADLFVVDLISNLSQLKISY